MIFHESPQLERLGFGQRKRLHRRGMIVQTGAERLRILLSVLVRGRCLASGSK